MQIDADSSDLDGLIRDFEALPKDFMPKVEKVTSKGALNIKQHWARIWSGHSSIAHLPQSVNYDIVRAGPNVDSEVGPAHDRSQGVLGHIIEFANTEYGTLRNSPIPGGQPALDAEEPKYVKALADLGEDSLEEGGGGR